MKAIIHIGTEKTGTSTIQECLHLNRDFLLRQGIAVFNCLEPGNNRNLATYALGLEKTDDHVVSLGIQQPEKRIAWKKHIENEFHKEYEVLKNEAHTAVISSEQFHSRLESTEEITTLFNFLNKYFNDISIIVYLRRQDHLATSLFSTMCVVGYKRKNILPLTVPESIHYFNYKELLDKWALVFGQHNIVPEIFEPVRFLHSDLLADFFLRHHLLSETDFYSLNIPPKINESISWQTQAVLLRFNKLFGTEASPGMQDCYQNIRNKLIQRINAVFPGQSMLPSRNAAKIFYNFFKNSNTEMGRKWFGTDNPFDENFDMYPPEELNYIIPERAIEHIFDVLVGLLTDKN